MSAGITPEKMLAVMGQPALERAISGGDRRSREQVEEM
jgi:hypothetical protein